MVFPLDILPVVSLASALFNAAVGTVVLIVITFVLGTPISWKIIYLPIILLPVLLLTLGVAWFLASLGVYVRDTAQIVALAVTALMFFSPIFYPAQMLPEVWRSVLYANPLSMPIEQARDAILFGQTPDVAALAVAAAAGLVIAWLGWLWFEKTRKGFADVL